MPILDDGLFLLDWAVRNGEQVPPEISDMLLSAAGGAAGGSKGVAQQQEIYAAFQQLRKLAGPDFFDIRAEAERGRRLAPSVAEAQRLVSYAVANAKDVEDGVRKDIVESADALARGSLKPGGEERFLKAYGQLTKALAPVTAETLETSRTRFPKLGLLISDYERFFRELASATAGRFFHSLAFVCLLLLTGAVLAHFTTGSTTLALHDAATEGLETALPAIQSKQLELEGATRRLEDAKVEKSSREVLAKAEGELAKARSELERSQRSAKRFEAELKGLGGAIADWLKPFCAVGWVAITCKEGTTPPKFVADIARDQTAQILLPMLLGLLGAYTFVLRSISVDIGRRSFAPGSSIHHLIRLFLGAMAGIASGWLLKPTDLGLLSSAPSWVLAFVAGYSVELVFSFMDRLVSAFSTRPA